jgi:hypothetical protein
LAGEKVDVAATRGKRGVVPSRDDLEAALFGAGG